MFECPSSFNNDMIFCAVGSSDELHTDDWLGECEWWLEGAPGWGGECSASPPPIIFSTSLCSLSESDAEL